MRSDWNRRVEHDYRFWMSDGYHSDREMWEAGFRDFSILLNGLSPAGKVILELGCGVGRLLLPSLESGASKVLGVDVSSSALQKAQELLPNAEELELILGNGYDLSAIPDNSVDIAFSFAAITSIPTDIIASYLCELRRIISDEGVIRLQMYLGREQQVKNDDTLHIRCFAEDRFREACAAIGFEIESIKALKLPIEVSFESEGIHAVIVSLRPDTSVQPAIPTEAISRMLLPEGEALETQDIGGAEVEYWMALNYAKELADHGDIEKARETLEYALRHFQSTSLDVKDLLTRITTTIERGEAAKEGAAEVSVGPSKFWEKNISVIRKRFPELAEALLSRDEGTQTLAITTRMTQEGVAIYANATCLDHPQKPEKSGLRWAEHLYQDQRCHNAAELFIAGFGAGYHIESLVKRSEVPVYVYEPSLQVLRCALESRDLTDCLEQIAGLLAGEISSSEIRRDAELFIRTPSQAECPEQIRHLKSLFYGVRGLELLHPNICVLGPYQGGTLPILGYTSRALAQSGQRVRPIDVSPFAAGFCHVEQFIKEDLRQATARGKYTEVVSDMVLEALNEKPIDILICMAQAPITGKTLLELRKRGVITVLWFVEDYLRFPVWQYMAQYYDFIFTIQTGECLNAIKSAGASEVHYLPTAADPGIHAPMNLSPDEQQRWGSPLSFVGAGYHNRQQMFASLAEMPFKIWGTEWPNCRPFDRMVQEGGRRLTPDEYVKIFNSTTVNLNLHSSTEKDGVDPTGDFVNPRTFELGACGAFQLVDRRSLLPPLLKEDEEIVCFSDRRELVEKIDYYLAHADERREIASRAQSRILREHTYDARIREMLSIIYSSRYEHLRARHDSSPWKRLLQRAQPHDELYERCDAAFTRGEEPILDGLVADVVQGKGKLSETEQKLMFLFHVRKQMIRMRYEESGKK